MERIIKGWNHSNGDRNDTSEWPHKGSYASLATTSINSFAW